MSPVIEYSRNLNLPMSEGVTNDMMDWDVVVVLCGDPKVIVVVGAVEVGKRAVVNSVVEVGKLERVVLEVEVDDVVVVVLLSVMGVVAVFPVVVGNVWEALHDVSMSCCKISFSFW